MKILMEMLSYPFLARAALVGLLVSACASLLGTSLVLKRYSMIGDGLSHVGFAALAIAYALNLAPMAVATPVCVAAAFGLLQLKESARIKGDAATALLCSGALAVGVMTVSLTTGMNTDVCNYMFGSILAMSRTDVWLSIALSAAVLILYVCFYHRIFAVTFDETFAQAVGIRARRYNMLLALLTAVTVVLGMRMMGTLLISSLIVFPSLTAMRVCRRFLTTVTVSVAVSLVCFSLGLALSYVYAIPTGAGIVMLNMGVFLLFSAVDLMKKRKGGMFLLALLAALVCSGCAAKPDSSSVSRQTEKDTETADDQKAPASYTVIDGVTYPYDDYPYDIEKDRETVDIRRPNIVVGDRYYQLQINDWFRNFEDYRDKTVEIEGFYLNFGAEYTLVGRNGPSCPYCTGGYVDFEFQTDEDVSRWISGVTWIKVTGILREGMIYRDPDTFHPFYYIEALKLEVMDEPGITVVSD